MNKKQKTKSLILFCLLLVFIGTVSYYKSIISEKKMQVPVLMYHHIQPSKKSDLIVSKEDFEQQMKYLSENGFKTLSLDEVYNYFKEGKCIPNKSVVLTFDDGYKDNYIYAYPVLKKYNFKATLFMISNNIGRGDYLTADELKELNSNNIDIQSHTDQHPKLSKMDYYNQFKSVCNSKKTLDELLNKKIKYLAYPYGEFNKDTVKALETTGYNMAFRINETWTSKRDGLYSLDRIFVRGDLTQKQFIKRVTDPKYFPIIKVIYHDIRSILKGQFY